VLLKVGDPDAGLREQETPESGAPQFTDRLTGWGVPLIKVTMIVVEPDPPCVRVIAPELEREKSKMALGGFTVNVTDVVLVSPPPVPTTISV